MENSHPHRAIVELCKQGDRKAQFELYRLYSRAMYNICLRLLNDAQYAEDALQHAFVDIFSKLDTFRHESSVGAWIKRITINHCINFIKKKRLTFSELQEHHTPEDGECGGGDYALNVDAIQKAIFMLPEGYRVVFSLYAMEGYDHEEIGQILGVTEATSKSQYSRAKAKLREILRSPQNVFV